MKKKYDLIVDNNYTDFKKGIIKYYMLIIVFFIIVEMINYKEIAAHICIIIMVYIPSALVIMYTCLFQVTLKEDIISVRNWRGKKYNFQTAEIKKVIIRITQTNGLPGETMKIKTKKCSFRVDRYKKNYYEFKDYIEKNVNPEKIKIIKKDFRTKKQRGEV